MDNNEFDFDLSKAVLVEDDEEDALKQQEGAPAPTPQPSPSDAPSEDTFLLGLNNSTVVTPPTQRSPEDLPKTPFAALDTAHEEGLLGDANYDMPAPNMNMYEDIERSGFLGVDGYEIAQKRYAMYADHPESTRTIDGRVVYKGSVVPQPSTALVPLPGANYNPTIGENIYGGVRNMAGNVAELAAATVDASQDFLQDKVGLPGEDLDLTEKVQENFAKVDPGDSIANTLLMEGTSMMLPGVVAMKAVRYGGKLSKLAKGLAFEAGAVAGASSDAGGVLIGENAMLSGTHDVLPFGWLLKGVQYEPDDPRYKKVLANRANILMDAMSVGAALETAVKGVSWGTRFAWSISGQPIVKVAHPTAKEETVTRQILDTLTGVTDDPKTTESARKAIIQLVEDNKEVYLEMPEGMGDTIRYTTDTMTAIERALANNDLEAAQSTIYNAQNIRKGIVQSGKAPKTVEAMAQPAKSFNKLTDQIEASSGGTRAIDTASDEMAALGMREVQEAKAPVANIEKQIADIDTALAQVIQGGDAGIMSKVTDLEKTVGFQINAGANRSADALRDRLAQASEVMDNEKNRLFGLVQGGKVDVDSMITVLQSLQPGQLDIAASAFPGDDMFGALLNQIKLGAKEVDGAVVRETEEEMRERVANWANENGLDYGTLFTNVRVSLSDSIGRMTSANASPAEMGAAQTLIKFKNWIDNDAINFVESTGNTQTVQAARDALNYFKNDWAKYWDDGSVLSDVGRLRRQTIGRGKQVPKFLDESRNIITDTLSNRNREVVGNMVGLLKRPEAGESAADVVDYIIGDTLTKISNRVDDPAKLVDLDISDIRASVQDHSAIIRQNFPEQADKLDQFLNTLRTAKGDKAALESQLKVAQKTAKEAEDRVLKRELSAFFQAGNVPNVSGYKSFEKLLNDPNALRREGNKGNLALVLDRARASGNPLIMDGVQAAYARLIRDKYLSATQEAGGNRMVALSALSKSENNINNYLEAGDAIYEDTPLAMRAVRGLLQEAGLVQRSRNAKAVGAGSGTAEAQEAMRAVDRTITMTLGVLSRLGARVRASASGVIMKTVDPEGTAAVLDRLAAEPDYFIQVATRVANKDRGIDPEGAELLRKWLIRSGVYSEDNEPNKQEFYMQILEADTNLQDALQDREVAAQTNEALQAPLPPQ